MDSSAWGVLDLAFGVSEWVGTEAGGFAVRGLSFLSFEHDVREGVLDWRKNPAPDYRNEALGFRCAQDLADTPAPPPEEGQ